MASRKFERHFEGPSNAGLRKKIRKAVGAVMPACGLVRASAARGACSNVALTGRGQGSLLACANDYEAAGGSYEPRCDCDSCVAVSRDNLAARRF